MVCDRPLSAAEVQAHPEFPYITWNLKPKSQGKLSVAKNRGGPLDIAWEVHGEGENKMVVSVFSSAFRHLFYLPISYGSTIEYQPRALVFVAFHNARSMCVKSRRKYGPNSAFVISVDYGAWWTQDLMAETNQRLLSHSGIKVLVSDCGQPRYG